MNALPWLVARPIAHRGLHDRAAGIVENTLSAAEAAIAAGFAIECDVQVTADGEAVVFHDFTLDRLTPERGPVRGAPRRGPDRDPRSPGRRTASRRLRRFLGRIAGRVPLVIEVKSRFDGDLRADAAHGRNHLRLMPGRSALKILRSRRDGGRAPARPRTSRAASSPRAATSTPNGDNLDAETKRSLANLLHFDETRPDFLSWRVEDLPCAAPFLSRLLAGLPVMTWTVRTDADRQRAAACGSDGFRGFRPA